MEYNLISHEYPLKHSKAKVIVLAALVSQGLWRIGLKSKKMLIFFFINEENFGHITRIFIFSVETLIAFSGYEANKESKSGNVPIFMNPLMMHSHPYSHFVLLFILCHLHQHHFQLYFR